VVSAHSGQFALKHGKMASSLSGRSETAQPAWSGAGSGPVQSISSAPYQHSGWGTPSDPAASCVATSSHEQLWRGV